MILSPNDLIIIEIINGELERKLKLFHLQLKYAYMVLKKKDPAKTFLASNYSKEWVEIYQNNNYQIIDPVVLYATSQISPFRWDENIIFNSFSRLNDIFRESRKFKIVTGYTFSLHDPEDNIALLSFIVDESTLADVESVLEEYKDKLQMLLIGVHEKYLRFYKESKQERENNSLKKGMLFSKRENEVLYWASMGKTYPEIAIILGIKTGTVKLHIGNVVKKLGVSNSKHAIRLGMELKLIRPVEV